MKLQLLKLFVFAAFVFGSQHVSAQYCASGAASTSDSKIDSVIVAGIVSGSSASNCETYTDNTALVGTVISGLNYDIRVVAGTCGGTFTRNFKIFVDWDNDGTFSQLADSIATLGPTTAGNAQQAFTHNFTVPLGVLPGPKRLRVVMSETSNPASFTSCGTFTWGETEDYTLNLLPASGLDAGMTALISPVAPVPGGSVSQVVSTISNLAADPITSGTVGYQVDNNAPVVEPWTGSILLGQTVNHAFAAPVTLPASGSFTLKTWFTNANGLGADDNTANDTLVSTVCVAMPTGLYTIGGSGLADYLTINDAIAAMNCGGISGAVTFAIEPGVYYGRHVISGISGASFTNQITFTSQTGLASDVVIIHDTSAAVTDKTIFRVVNTPNVTFNALTLRRTQNQNTGVFANILASGSDFLGVLSCVLEENISSSSVSFNSNGVRMDGGNNATILGNTFTGFYNSVYLTAPTANSNYASFNTVSGNIVNNYRYGIYILNQAGGSVTGNEINNAATTFSYGIYGSRVVAINISDNRVLGNMVNAGIYLFNPNDSTLGPNVIANNVISGTYSGSSTFTACYGIYASGSVSHTATNPVNGLDALNIYHNTINITYPIATSSTFGLIHLTGGSNFTPAWGQVNIINNHATGFAGSASGLPANMVALLFQYDSLWNVTSSDYNNLALFDQAGTLAASNNVVRVSDPLMTYATVSAWSTASGRDAFSVSSNPGYTGPNLPIPTAQGVNDLGTPLAVVPADILGTPRSTSTPDIGAYEFTPNPFDLAAVGIGIPGGCAGPNQSITVSVRNVGTNTFNFATDSLVISLNIGGPLAQSFSFTVNSDSLQVDSIRTFTVTGAADLTLGGAYTFNATLAANGDGNNLNDGSTRNFTVVAGIPAPYQQDFNAPGVPLGFTTNMTNNPVGVGQSGGLRFNVFSSQIANLTMPIIGPLDTGAVFDFDYKVTDWPSAFPGTATTMGVDDTIKIFLSTDCGQSFFLHDFIAGGNHVATNAFTTKRVLLGAFANQQVVIRMVFQQFSGIDVFFDVDNFNLFTPSPQDVGVLSFIAPNSGCGLTNAETVTVRVVNFGTTPQVGFPVSYTLNGVVQVTDTITTSINPNDTLNHTFSVNADLSIIGQYTLRAYSGLVNDALAANDTINRTVTHIPLISSSVLPYTENFENGPGGWIAGGNNSSWALGTPAGVNITAASSGTNAWVTNLSGNYNNSEESYVQSPCFDFTGIFNAEISFDLFWDTENNWDKGVMYYSTDGGITWTVLGAIGSGINWYNLNTTFGPIPGTNVWSGVNSGWGRSVHDLNVVNNEPSVQFRMGFFSDGSFNNFDGLAFDSLTIRVPVDPIITRMSVMSDSCEVAPRNISASITHFAPLTNVDLHYDLTATGTHASVAMTYNPTDSTWNATIPTSNPATRVNYFITALDSAFLVDTSASHGYIDAYLSVNAGNDTTIVVGDSATLRATTTGFTGSAALRASTLGGNGSAGVSFNVRALSAVNIDSMLLPISGTGPVTVNIWHSTTAVSGPPNVAVGSGWTLVGSALPTTGLNVGTGPNALLSAVAVPGGIVIPTGQTHGFFCEVVGGTIIYTSHTTANQDTFTDGNIVIYTGPNVGYGGSAPSPTFHPRQFNGAVSYASGSNVHWMELGSTTVLHSGDTFRTAPLVTTTYVALLTDSVCTATDTVTVFVGANNAVDIGVSQIMSPMPGTPDIGQPSTVQVVIENFGNNPVTNFDVAFAIDGVELNANPISRTVPPMDTIHHIFSLSWTPTAGGDLNMCAYTKGLAGDIDPSNDTICRTYMAVNVEETEQLIGNLYPNPADQFVNIVFAATEGNGKLEIRDNLGRLVHSEFVDLANGNVVEVKTDRFASGVYNYRFVLQDKVQQGQLMIRR